MDASELKKLLISKTWIAGNIIYTFKDSSFSKNGRIESQYSIENKGDKLYLTNTSLRSGKPLLIVAEVKDGISIITISPEIEGDTGWTSIILSEKE